MKKLLLLTPLLVVAQVAGDSTVRATWDNPVEYLDINGNPETLDRFEWRALDEGGSVISSGSVPPEARTVDIALSDGTYRVEVRAVDAAGNPSEWAWKTIAVDTVPPEKPSNFGCAILR